MNDTSKKFFLLILQQLPKDSQTGISFRTAIALAVVQILAAAETKSFTIGLAQQL